MFAFHSYVSSKWSQKHSPWSLLPLNWVSCPKMLWAAPSTKKHWWQHGLVQVILAYLDCCFLLIVVIPKTLASHVSFLSLVWWPVWPSFSGKLEWISLLNFDSASSSHIIIGNNVEERPSLLSLGPFRYFRLSQSPACPPSKVEFNFFFVSLKPLRN